MILRLLMATVSTAALGTPAHAVSPVVYRGVALSTGDTTVTPGRCSTTMRAAVYYTDPDRQGPPAGSGIVVAAKSTGTAVGIAGVVEGWRNGVSSVTYSLRLCGLDAPAAETEAGWYRVAVRPGPQAPAVPRAGFTVRYQGIVSLDAGPEPVRRGGYVTVTASVTDGWEYFDPHPVRVYFRRAQTTVWRYFGTATPRCDQPCGDGEVSYTATRRFRQTVAGTWKVVSARTSYLESGSRSDAVAVA
ncbi:hypothetical protein ACWKSP_30925 [Micromonosporaceae bacterium Da 78-11]